ADGPACGRCPRCEGSRRHQALRHGQTVRHRRRLRHRQPGPATARRLWLSEGLSIGADCPGPARSPDPGGNQRDYARDHRPRALQAMSEPEVLIGVDGEVGRLTLNRPAAIHALTTNTVGVTTRALLDWRVD